MTQPAARKGPVLQGSPERYGNSRQGVSELLGNIQDSARGTAEWIDGLPTGSGANPAQAHDHRGGVWGRPLGVGHSMPMRRGAPSFGSERYEAVSFLNVPDVSSPGGSMVESAAENGGYQFVNVLIYSAPGAGTFTFQFSVSVWSGREWSEAQVTLISHVHPGGGPLWTTLDEGLDLPPGLVRLSVTSRSYINQWEWTALAVTH